MYGIWNVSNDFYVSYFNENVFNILFNYIYVSADNIDSSAIKNQEKVNRGNVNEKRMYSPGSSNSMSLGIGNTTSETSVICEMQHDAQEMNRDFGEDIIEHTDSTDKHIQDKKAIHECRYRSIYDCKSSDNEIKSHCTSDFYKYLVTFGSIFSCEIRDCDILFSTDLSTIQQNIVISIVE